MVRDFQTTRDEQHQPTMKMNSSDQKVSKPSREIANHRGPLRVPGERADSTSRQEMQELIKTHAGEIIQSVQNVTASAPEVFAVLQKLGHLGHIRKANGVGDVLGEKGLKLPFSMWKQKRHYLLLAIEWDAQTLEAFHGLSRAEQVVRTRALEMELLGFDSGKYDTPEMKAEKEAFFLNDAKEAIAKVNGEAEADTPEVVWAAEEEEEDSVPC